MLRNFDEFVIYLLLEGGVCEEVCFLSFKDF